MGLLPTDLNYTDSPVMMFGAPGSAEEKARTMHLLKVFVLMLVATGIVVGAGYLLVTELKPQYGADVQEAIQLAGVGLLLGIWLGGLGAGMWPGLAEQIKRIEGSQVATGTVVELGDAPRRAALAAAIDLKVPTVRIALADGTFIDRRSPLPVRNLAVGQQVVVRYDADPSWLVIGDGRNALKFRRDVTKFAALGALAVVATVGLGISQVLGAISG